MTFNLNLCRLSDSAIITGIALTLLISSGVYAQEAPTDPTDFAAETVTFYENENRVVLTDNATISGKEFTVDADEIEVFLIEDEAGERSVDRLVAHGNIVADIEGAETTSDQAEYNAQTRKALFTGNVETVRNGSIVRGEQLEADVNTGVYHIIGGVNGVIKGSL